PPCRENGSRDKSIAAVAKSAGGRLVTSLSALQRDAVYAAALRLASLADALYRPDGYKHWHPHSQSDQNRISRYDRLLCQHVGLTYRAFWQSHLSRTLAKGTARVFASLCQPGHPL